MKYRTKLYLSFLITTFFCVLVSVIFIYFEAKREVYRELSSQVLSIATTTSVSIPVEGLPAIQDQKDMQLPSYKKIRKKLQKIMEANRREDIYVRYMFIVRPSEKKGFFETVVDAAEKRSDLSLTGELHSDEELSHLSKHLNAPYAPKEFLQDPDGYWLVAFAPLKNDQGNYLASLGVIIFAKAVIKEEHRFILFGLVALGIGLFIAMILAYFLAKRTTESLNTLCNAVDIISKGDLKVRVPLPKEEEFRKLSIAVNEMCVGLEERDRLKVNFSRYVSAHILERILTSRMPLKLEGERKEITVLFSDIREFTTLSEKIPPEEVVLMLNEYFDRMLDIIFKNSGTLDKFLGDGIMVEFGSPLNDSEKEYHAIKTAIEMQQELKKLSDEWEAKGKPRIRMSIGIHTGEAVVGNIGTDKRMEFTAIGDAVNVASRTLDETKKRDETILVTAETWEQTKEHFEAVSLGDVVLPGRTQSVVVYLIKGFRH